ncbi:MAG TPA: TIGR02710 family CRISPR-associated CARF protein [Methanospirillum sp.]|uniref:TIGR02710 family CRISPR-associated CARF protein n=1 Tax=Methanospirillum sp. TaxID=45200 RepID=UPI002B61F67E|nr:TIGR02710 family CRISPR-associated CARF protein [Methanospirillum sp.]HWQ64787.1 TIGR02710 family CRISPR-associated CARF protein [Methanospirillum sp.]
MTVGTGIGSDTVDAIERLVRSCSYAIHFYRPEHIIYFCSPESKELVSNIEEGCKRLWGQEPPESEACIIRDPNDFSQCFEVIYGVCVLFQEFEIVIDASSGTRSMTMAASIVSFLTRSQVAHVTGEKKGGLVIPGTEKMKEMTLFAAYDRLRFHQAVDQFNNNHFGSSLELLSGLSTIPERDLYYALFHGYYSWDKLNYTEAFRYLQHADDLTEGVARNREFLQKLLELEAKGENGFSKKEQCRYKQEKYLYVLVDLLNNAKRRIEGERYDDAFARLYRVVELLSQVLLLSWNIDDIEGKIHFTDLRKILRSKKDVSLYARRADRKGVIRIGLRSKFMLLEDLGMQGAGEYYLHLEPFLRIRNESILAHGLSPVHGDEAREMWNEVFTITRRACIDMPFDLEHLLVQSAYPQLETPMN